jgi:hypothetical protein
MAVVPEEAGASQVTVTVWLPDTDNSMFWTEPGALVGVPGSTATLGVLGSELPLKFVATTLKV